MTLRSYGGRTHATPRVVEPRSVAELMAFLEDADRHGHEVAPRGAGGSFHDQALHRDRVLSSLGLPVEAEVVEQRFLRASAGVTTAQMLDVSLAHNCAPAVLPTSRRLTLGGMVGANCVSRWSMARGKCSMSLRAIDAVLANGRAITLRADPLRSDSLESRLFRAIPGAFGALGFIVGVEMELVPLPSSLHGPQPPRVWTDSRVTSTYEEAAEAMVSDYLAYRDSPRGRDVGSRHVDDPNPLCTWMLADQAGRGVVFRSCLTAPDTPLSPLILHQPDRLLNHVGQLGSALPWWTELGATLFIETVRRRSEPFVDTLAGFSFMMDANWSARDAMRRVGIDIWVAQQSFVIPVDCTADDAAREFKTFLADVHEEAAKLRLSVSVLDALISPPDATLLSSSNGTEGALITLTFMGLTAAKHKRVLNLFRVLSRRCAELGGQIHLVKHVHAEPDVLEQMYGPALRELASIRAEVDPRGILGGDFIRRLLSDVGASGGSGREVPADSDGPTA